MNKIETFICLSKIALQKLMAKTCLLVNRAFESDMVTTFNRNSFSPCAEYNHHPE